MFMKVTKNGFIILHYMVFEMTEKCVDSILKTFNTNNISIVIVDNNSSNDSCNQLINKYKNVECVTIIKNIKNLGFANGNNVGYQFLKNKDNFDYIIDINNDVIIDDKDFLNKISTIYDKTNFAILGPDIYNPKTNKHQNPTYINDLKHINGMSKNEIQRLQKIITKKNKHFFYYYIRDNLLKNIRKLYLKQKEIKVDITKEYENCVLHGACLIFSKEFINSRNYAFNPNTFLYFEEDILHYEIQKLNLKTYYSPIIKIEHYEDVSTDSLCQTNYKKEKLKMIEIEKSMKVFLELPD